MSLMSIEEVATFLGVQPIRVERLAREHLLIAKQKDTEDKPLFDQNKVEKYQQ